MRLLASAAVLVALVAVATSAGAQAAPPPCTPAQLAGSRTPVVLEAGSSSAPARLLVGRRYTAVVVQELAGGDFGSARDGSIRVASADVQLTGTTSDGRPAYSFTSPPKGPVRFTVTWIQEEIGNPSNACSASATFLRHVQSLRRVKIAKGRVVRDPRTADVFLLNLTAPRPANPAAVTVLVRARRGSRPPRPRGAATYKARLVPNRFGAFGRTSERGLRRLRALKIRGGLTSRGKGAGVGLYPDANIAFGRPLRFAFSMEVRQGGRRIGGYRAAASCRRLQKRGFSVVRCKVSRAAQRP